MTDKANNDLNDMEKALLKLIGMADEAALDSSERPSMESIAAFLAGEVTDEQRQQVYSVMNRSKSFRRDMLDLMKDFSAFVAEDQVDHAVDSTSDSEENLVSKPTFESRGVSWVGRLKEMLNLKIIAPALVAAAALVLMFWQPIQREPTWMVVAENVDPAEVVSFDLRGSESKDSLKFYPAAEEAAKAAFSEILFFDGSQISVRNDYKLPLRSEHGDNLTVTVVTDDGSVAEQHLLRVDITGSIETRTVLAWWLTIPSLELLTQEVVESRIEIPLSYVTDDSGCLAITYQVDGRYAYLPAIPFGLRTD